MGLRPVSLSRDLFLGALKCTQSPHPHDLCASLAGLLLKRCCHPEGGGQVAPANVFPKAVFRIQLACSLGRYANYKRFGGRGAPRHPDPLLFLLWSR